MDFEAILEKYKLQIGMGLVGLLLLGIAVLLFLVGRNETPKVEIISEANSSATIFVDIEGAVQTPGIYELPVDSRVNDLLVRAGGLSAEADREWTQKNLNLAQKLTDGIKIYVPAQDENLPDRNAAPSAAGGKVNINTASLSELDSLWGIGESRAKNIISNRPYQNIEELISRKIIPQNVYEQIKEQITAY